MRPILEMKFLAHPGYGGTRHLPPSVRHDRHRKYYETKEG
jgi:hypothetical protein